MVTRSNWKMGMLVGIVAVGFVFGSFGVGWAAEQDKQTKKPKAAPATKSAAPKAKAEKPKFHSAETAAKAQACFGDAPKIEKVTPDEGKAGVKVTITGKNFGTPDCLRSVSFGPGHAATFQQVNESQLTATVPTGGRKGIAILTVTTASGEDSKPFLMK